MTYNLPSRPVVMPSNLKGQANGKLGPCQMDAVFFAGVGHASLNRVVIRNWNALNVAVYGETGRWLTITSLADAFRSYDRQLAVFNVRMSPVYDPATCTTTTRTFNGKTWWLKKGYAPCATPGTSNHGWGLALDVALYDPNRNDGDAYAGDPVGITSNPAVWAAFQRLAPEFGFSWEGRSGAIVEPWHIRYVLGDEVAQRTIDVERFLAALGGA